MQHKTTKHLFTYWNDVRDGRLAPRRFDIEPAQISEVLPDTFMLERIARSIYRFRLAGTRICDQFQSEFRGVDFLEGWSPEDTTTLERQLAAISDQGGVGLFAIEARTVGGESVPFEIVILPLVHTDGMIDRFLGAVSPLETPAWLGSERLVYKRLIRHEIVWPDGRPHAVVDRAHRQVPFLPHVRNARIVRFERRQFRVYDGGLTKPEGDKA
ncbi:MAG: PAS domain-containing protein [Hyphomicrobium sp.]